MAVNTAKLHDFTDAKKHSFNAQKVVSIENEEEEFYPQNKGEISDSITQNWTEQALECYRLKCDCSLCSISKGQYSFVCQMPKVLDILINISGKPVSI